MQALTLLSLSRQTQMPILSLLREIGTFIILSPQRLILIYHLPFGTTEPLL